MNIGETIRARRIMLGMTQKDLSEKSGISRPTISAYEHGSYKLDVIEALLNAMDLELRVGRKTK